MMPRKQRRIWSSQNDGACAKCGRKMAKRRMVALLVRETRYVNPATLCHVCHDCLPGMLDYLGVGMPERE